MPPDFGRHLIAVWLPGETAFILDRVLRTLATPALADVREEPASVKTASLEPLVRYSFGVSTPLMTLCGAACATGLMVTRSRFTKPGSSMECTIASAMSSA